MKLWVSNIVFVETGLRDFPSPLLTICNRTEWKGLGEPYCRSIWFPPGFLMTSSREGDRGLGHSVWFGGLKANVSPASFGSLSAATVYWMQSQFKAQRGQACGPTQPHNPQRQISEILPSRHTALLWTFLWLQKQFCCCISNSRCPEPA